MKTFGPFCFLLVSIADGGRIYDGSVNRQHFHFEEEPLHFKRSREGNEVSADATESSLFEATRRRSLEDPTTVHSALPTGDPLCPCLTLDTIGEVSLEDTTAVGNAALQPPINITAYGIGCHQHDLETASCLDVENPPAFCSQQFCYVDPSHCSLLHQRSFYFQSQTSRFYSYATCYDADQATWIARIDSLRNRTLRVGLTSNSGGWSGSYHKDGEHFSGPLLDWSGPMVEFLKSAADIAEFDIDIVEPPIYLWDRSNQFFGNTDYDVFDVCIYATALGWLDLCIGQFSITNKRAATTPFFVLLEENLRFVVQNSIPPAPYSMEGLKGSVGMVFAPLEGDVWLFLIFFVFPTFGLLTLCHERGNPSFPRYRPRRSEDEPIRRTPLWLHMIKSLYTIVLSVFQEEYSETVYTTGGWIHLLGIGILTLGLIEVYTANLAAILTNEAQVNEIRTVSEAVRAGYRFCADRNLMQLSLNLVDQLDDGFFVKDPVDGQPGFVNDALLKFERMDMNKAFASTDYCHVAIAVAEDLETEQEEGRHCDKMSISTEILGHIAVGFPLFEDRAPAFTALFQSMQNEGIFASELQRARPMSQCIDEIQQQEDSENPSLGVNELTGIWAVCGVFMLLGLATKCWMGLIQRRRQRLSQRRRRHEIDETNETLELDEGPSNNQNRRRSHVGQPEWSSGTVNVSSEFSPTLDDCRSEVSDATTRQRGSSVVRRQVEPRNQSDEDELKC